MLRQPPARFLTRILPALSVTLLYGCSDAPTPLEPRFDARPHMVLGPEVVVTNTDDSGPGSLRQTIADAADGSVIHFDAAIAGQTIVLTTGQIVIDKSLTIEGPVPAGMTISGGFNSRVFFTESATTVVFRDLSIVNGNDATTSPGSPGGAAIWVTGVLLLERVLLANNISTNTGGAIFVKTGGQLTLVNSTVSGNVGGSGGAILFDGPTTIWNSTITDNTALSGGGLVANDNLYLRNSIVANNTDSDAVPANENCYIRTDGRLFVSGTSLSNDESCGTTGVIVAPNVGIGPLANNGGPTKTHALLLGSPAIDAGSSCTESTDQRHVARNQGTSCDIGAFEFNDFATVTVTIGPNIAVNAKTGTATVTGTVKCSAPVGVLLNPSLSQTQKTKGKFSTIVQASASSLPVACGTANSAVSWSIPLTPPSGAFEPGAATATVSGSANSSGWITPTVTTTVKLFQAK